jgi:hypothetical protein
MEEENKLALIVKKENNISKLDQMKIITPQHNQKKENKENWGNFSCEKMKAKKIEKEKKYSTTNN